MDDPAEVEGLRPQDDEPWRAECSVWPSDGGTLLASVGFSGDRYGKFRSLIEGNLKSLSGIGLGGGGSEYLAWAAPW